MAPVLAYWPIRGLAQPIRLLLKYNNVEFEDKRFTAAQNDEGSGWFDVKFTLGLDFPNLPYYIEDGVKITQSNAILRYIARKHNMCGNDEKDKVIVDMLENQLMDFRNGFVRLCYNVDAYDTNRPTYIENAKKTIKAFADFLGEKHYLVGNELTFVDFVMYELLDQHRLFEPSLLEPHKNLKNYLARFEAIPSIATYMKSDEFITRPINGKVAAFK